MIRVCDVSAGYLGNDVIKNIDVQFNKGEITTIIGPNGSGKSTLIKVISRVLNPTTGNVYLDNKNINQINIKEYAKLVSLLPQTRNTPTIDVETLVYYGRFPHTGAFGYKSKSDKEHVERALELTDIKDLRYKSLLDMSGGEKQKAFIAMTLAQDTDIILLDEPTTFLDISYQLEIMEILKKLNNSGKTIIMVLHDLQQAINYSDRICVMDKGKVVTTSTPTELMEKGILDRVFNVRVKTFSENKKQYHFFELGG